MVRSGSGGEVTTMPSSETPATEDGNMDPGVRQTRVQVSATFLLVSWDQACNLTEP